MFFETLSIASIFPFLDYIFEGSKNMKDYLFLNDILRPRLRKLSYLLNNIFYINLFY